MELIKIIGLIALGALILFEIFIVVGIILSDIFDED